MEGIIEEHIVADILQYEDKKYGEKPAKVRISGIKYFLCHMTFFLLGVIHFLPISFLAAANNFWMHKFRNVSDPDGSASNRTYLQKNFASTSMIANTIPALIFGILNVTHGHRFKIMNRVITSLAVEVAIFILLTISVKTDTDNFQLVFFIGVLSVYAILSGANSVNIVSSMNLFSRFPHEFMKTCLIGEGCSGIVGDILNILSIYAFSNDITNATLMYFCFGTFVLGFTLALSIIMSKADFFNECINSIPQKSDKKIPKTRDLLRILKKIRFVITLFSIFMIGFSATHTAVTALVVSEDESINSSWAINYFSPVMTFLLGDVGMLVGRILSYIPVKVSEVLFLIFAVISMLILVPFIWLCNAQPRKHLPVLFPHDYQYGLIFGTFMLTNGYMINLSSFYIVQKVHLHESDMAFTLFGLAISVIQTLSSPIGIFIVNIL